MRCGLPAYINAMPLAALQSEWEFVRAPPAQLNRWMEDGTLDISFVSSIYYLQHRDTLQLVPGYGIGAEGKVLSVLLFYPEHLQSFDGVEVRVGLDPESATSNRIARWLLTKVYKAKPLFVKENPEAFVLIGDKCLTFQCPKGYRSLDLGEEWVKATGLPLPFAVVAARKGAYIGNLQETLQRSLDWFSLNKKEVSKQQNTVSEEIALSYWDHLAYVFDHRYQLSLDYMYANLQ